MAAMLPVPPAFMMSSSHSRQWGMQIVLQMVNSIHRQCRQTSPPTMPAGLAPADHFGGTETPQLYSRRPFT